MFTFGLATGGAAAFDPLALLLAALAVEAYIGEARWLFKMIPHPVVVIGRAVGWCDARLNRDSRPAMDRAVRGLLVTTVLCAAAGTVGFAFAWLTRIHPLGWVFEFALLVTLVAGRSLYDHVKRVAAALDDGGLDAGRNAVSHIVGRDPHQLDRHGVCRAATESLAENFSDGVVAPAFWYVLFGLPGILIYKTVNTLDSMIGHRTPRHQAFGMVAARLDDVVNLIPARLAGLFIVLAAAFVPKAKPWAAFKVMMRDAGKHRSPNAGWPEGAMAGALGVALAGPRRYSHAVVDDPWIGDGSARMEPRELRRGLRVFIVANLINALWIACLVIVRLTS
jgi:adenosylcobinamide-phosphate synthase